MTGVQPHPLDPAGVVLDRTASAAIRPAPVSELTRVWRDPNPTKALGTWGTSGSYAGAPAGLLSVMFRMAETERIQRPFAQSGIVNACVQVRAELFCAARPRLWTADDEDADELAPEDELSKLFARPNGLMGRIKFWRTISQHFSLAGGTFLFLTKPGSDEPIEPGGMPGAMWPVREELVEIKLDEFNRPALYEFAVGERRVKFPEHAVAHIYDADPDNPYRGIGPMQAAFRAVNNLYLAEGFDDALVRSGGQIGGFIIPSDGSSLQPEQQKELIDSLKQKHLDPKNSGNWAVTPEGLKFQAAAWSPKDMEAKELRIIGRNHVMMVFRLTPPLLGIVEDVNRANGREARRVFYEAHGIPFFEFVADEVQAQLFPKLGRPEVALSFDWQSIPAMREDADAQQKRVRGWMECGRSFKEAVTIEAIEIDEFDSMEGVDERYIASGLTPVELAHMPPPAPVVPSGDDETPEPPKKDANAKVTRDAMAERRRRIDAIAENEKRLAPADRAMTRGIANVFKRYVRAQLERLREVAASADGVSASVTPWETPLRSLGPIERVWAERMDLVPEQGWIVVRGVTPDELEQLLIRLDEKWRAELWGAVEKPLRRALEDAARAAAQQVEAATQIDTAAHPALARFVAQKELLLKEGPMSVVAQQVRRALVVGLSEATSIGTLADRVRGVLEELQDELETLSDKLGTRAQRIARTETASAANSARFEQWRAAGIAQHEWIDSGDDIVRDEHAIGGEIVVIGERFSNGMLYPGEPGQPASLIVECRCLTAPVIQQAVEAA